MRCNAQADGPANFRNLLDNCFILEVAHAGAAIFLGHQYSHHP